MERQKINEREKFEYEEKMGLMEKSDGRCCHCGKKYYFGYGATVEHYVPISKGGTNRDINLIMLCETCNNKKGDKIISPQDYLPYLKKEHLAKLEGYFDSYIRSFDYVKRNNLLSCDEYLIRVAPHIKGPRKKKSRVYAPVQFKKYQLKRVEKEDLPKINDYFKKYLKKYGLLDSRHAAEKNIEFWYRFGCIYYLEDKNGIKSIFALTVQRLIRQSWYRNTDRAVQMYVFPYYSNRQTKFITEEVYNSVIFSLLKEQNIPYIPFILTMAKNDESSGFYAGGNSSMEHFIADTYRFISTGYIAGTRDSDESFTEEDDEEVKKFFDIFEDVEKKAEEWCRQPENEEVDWMLETLDMRGLKNNIRIS